MTASASGLKKRGFGHGGVNEPPVGRRVRAALLDPLRPHPAPPTTKRRDAPHVSLFTSPKVWQGLGRGPVPPGCTTSPTASTRPVAQAVISSPVAVPSLPAEREKRRGTSGRRDAPPRGRGALVVRLRDGTSRDRDLTWGDPKQDV